MASILKRLSDDDRLALNHRIRRDEESDAAIWVWASSRLPAPAAPRKEEAGAMVVARYRRSAEFRRWLERWENQDVELKKDLAKQAQRFELLSNLVKDPEARGMEALSRSLQARLLTLAAEASDEELVTGVAKNGWVKGVIRVIQEEAKIQRDQAGSQAVAVAQDGALSPEERARKMREIFGLS